MRTKYVAEIFRNPPSQWGLRGDPYLWDLMATRLADQPMPPTRAELVSMLDRVFEEISGHAISHENDFHLDHIPQAGMSGGWISVEAWRNRLVPHLIRTAGLAK